MPSFQYRVSKATRSWRDFARPTEGGRWPLIITVASLVFGYAPPVQPDQWELPTPRTVVSLKGGWSASVTPGAAAGPGPRIGVTRKSEAGSIDGWKRALVNRVAPVDLFVSDTGAVVTLGDWHSEGYEHAIVIYDSKGKVIVDQQLEDFLTKEELEKTEQTVSSRWWRYRSEVPEFVGEEFSLTTSWGTSLRFDVGTGRLSREAGLFARFQRYCDGTRPAREAVIYISRVWKQGERYTGRHCEVRRPGAMCQSGGERYRSSRAETKITFSPQQFDGILKDAAALAPYIVDDGVYEFDRAFLHVQIVFGENVVMAGWGAPKGGDTYWLRYKPAEVPAAAREWSRRLETLVRAR
jgi:hypothetical protein